MNGKAYVVAVWSGRKGDLQKHGAAKVWVRDGALMFAREDGRTAFVIAPGDWHDLSLTYSDDEDDE